MAERPPIPAAAPQFWALLPRMRAAAREHGYALTVHGSMTCDLDIVLVPWVDDAADMATVVKAVRDTFCGIESKWFPNPERKPHGRVAWSYYFEPHDETNPAQKPYVDISVMPRHKRRKGG